MKHLGLYAAILTLAVPAAASAASSNEPAKVVRMTYQDLNLSQERGAARMLVRIDRGAMKACGGSDASLRDVQEAVRRSDCHKTSVANAVADLNAPTVTALYRERDALRLASN